MPRRKCEDHLGNQFSSVMDMCIFYNIEYKALIARLKTGMSLEDSLTKPLPKYRMAKKCTDHKGNQFKSAIDMCKYYNIDYAVFRRRIKMGWNLQRALEQPVQRRLSVQDHKGNWFDSIDKMCEYYDINRTTYVMRRKAGLSLEEALTTPNRRQTKQKAS